MNSGEYVRREALHTLRWDEKSKRMVAPKNHICFAEGQTFTEDRYCQWDSEEKPAAIFRKTGKRLEQNMEASAREYLKDWDINLDNYACEIEFDSVVCEIFFIHKKTGNVVRLYDVYFNDITGEIRQSLARLG